MKKFGFKDSEGIKIETLLNLIRQMESPISTLFPKGTSS